MTNTTPGPVDIARAVNSRPVDHAHLSYDPQYPDRVIGMDIYFADGTQLSVGSIEKFDPLSIIVVTP